MLPTNTAKDSQNHGALLFLVTYAAAITLLLFSPKYDAYEWALVPTMRTDLIYTDNVELASGRGLDKKGQWRYSARPWIIFEVHITPL